MNIRENYNLLENLVAGAALRSGREPESVRIIAVSKTFSYEKVQNAIDAGIFLFGENKVQEAKSKIPSLSGNFAFHMVGHLQSNKARDAVKFFDLIHSIDSQSTAERVNAEANKIGKIQKILIQVNPLEETTKNGAKPDEAVRLTEKCLTMENIELLGFMNIGPLSDDMALIRRSFVKTRKILERTNNLFKTSMKELSMGMSGDFEMAIEEGATMVRIGSLIFGERNYT
ncbi:MAG: YggS family pyridoxal phosphate-dependent enzyme [Leptospirales bacterium]|nr:YggS family pyridoxal phosphate-dependent enzyme [Leptospirales bacterium]